ncbi:MAG TPA: hypothetical protein VLG68_00820 [Gammaproteobacteria bacterium]|nr:hypothetical protein [Gammaproteobacteria bacterium]
MTALIGVYNANRVYVYRYTNGSWTASLLLVDLGQGVNDQFGAALALSRDGKFALVCAPGARKGYVYNISSGLTLVATLTSPSGLLGDDFCASAALPGTGDLAVIGAPLAKVGTVREAGAVYVYTPASNGIWSNTAVAITEPGGAVQNDSFGNSLALSSDGSKLLVGALFAKVGGIASGKVYLLDLKGGIGTLSQEFDDPAGGSDVYGWALALAADGSRVLVAAPFTSVSGAGASGQAYIYTLNGGSWGAPQVFSDTQSSVGQFGGSVALTADGNLVLIGEPSGDKAFTASFASGSWSKLKKLTDPVNSPVDAFGVVGLSGSGNVAFIGAPNTRSLGIPNVGMVYEYGLPSKTCTSNCGGGSSGYGTGKGGYPLLVLLALLGMVAGRRRGMGLRIKG